MGEGNFVGWELRREDVGGAIERAGMLTRMPNFNRQLFSGAASQWSTLAKRRDGHHPLGRANVRDINPIQRKRQTGRPALRLVR